MLGGKGGGTSKNSGKKIWRHSRTDPKEEKKRAFSTSYCDLENYQLHVHLTGRAVCNLRVESFKVWLFITCAMPGILGKSRGISHEKFYKNIFSEKFFVSGYEFAHFFRGKTSQCAAPRAAWFIGSPGRLTSKTSIQNCIKFSEKIRPLFYREKRWKKGQWFLFHPMVAISYLLIL